jgi:N-glycosylase/DNA lyase
MTPSINAPDFDLAATVECGQAFRWSRSADGWWTGIVNGSVRRVRQTGDRLEGDFEVRYFSLDLDLRSIVATFPEDEPLRLAVRKHWGLRILRQEPWETLASFIASSTKQIVQIRQIVELLAQRLGRDGAFPDVETMARAELPALLKCKLGFRAKYLQSAARMIDSGQVRLMDLAGWEYERALEELQKISGVGEKIANCTLLFGCGFHQAFPVDVWVERSIKRLYFPRRRVTPRQLREFTRSHFGPYAGWAQQYLFYAERMRQAPPEHLTTRRDGR